MIRKTIVSIVMIALMLGGAAAVSGWLVSNRPQPTRRDAGQRAPLVETVTLQPVDARETLHGYGTVRPDQQAMLRAEIAAPVLQRVNDLESGDAVREGDLLLRLDDREYVQQLAEAESAIAAAEAAIAQLDVERSNLGSLLDIAESDLVLNADERERVRKLHEQGNAPKKELDDAKLAHLASLRAAQQLKNDLAMLKPRRLSVVSEKEAAEARARRAELNIERCRIVAPFDGEIASIEIDVGDKVQIGTELLRIINTDRLEIPVELPISRRLATRVGAPVALTIESMNSVKWRGTIARIAPTADERSRTFQAYVEVDNTAQSQPLLPGAFVKAEVAGPVHAGALLVPRHAIVEGRVFVANAGEAHARNVTVDRPIGDDVVLAGGVEPGDEVIVSNLDMLYDGAQVQTAANVTATADDVLTNGLTINPADAAAKAAAAKGNPEGV